LSNSKLNFLLFFSIIPILFFGSISSIEAQTTIKSDTIFETLTIESGEILIINSQVTVIANIVDNFGLIENYGTIRIAGIIKNHITGGINNNLGGTIEILQGGSINIVFGSSVTNSGIITNKGIINIYDGGTIINKEGGILTNENAINNLGGTIFNQGTIDILLDADLINEGGTIINKGSITNSGEIRNKNIISNNFGGTITNNPQGIITNEKTIVNFGRIINNAGIISTLSGDITNQGAIYNCDGVFEGISSVKFNAVLFDCETTTQQVSENSQSNFPTTQSSSDENTNSESEIICGPRRVLKDGVCIEGISIPQQGNGKISDWMKNIIAQWANGNVGNGDFIEGIRSLVYDEIIDIPEFAFAETSQPAYAPQWFSHTAGWWSEGLISEDEFLNAVKYLVERNIIRI